MNDVYIIDLSTTVVCVDVWVLVHGHVHVCVCVYLFVSVCCNGQTFLYVVTVRVCRCIISCMHF